MGKIRIKVVDYYNHPEIYAFIPMAIFDLLEAAFLDGSESAMVPEEDYYLMTQKIISSYGCENN